MVTVELQLFLSWFFVIFMNYLMQVDPFFITNVNIKCENEYEYNKDASIFDTHYKHANK